MAGRRGCLTSATSSPPTARTATPESTLFEHQEICRTRDLEALVRHANAMAGCRSFDDVVGAGHNWDEAH
jgi:hypothetical protein